MKLHNKLFCISLSALSLSLAACSDKNDTKTNTDTQSVQEIKTSQGNWQAKADSLSKANESDIKADLAQINQLNQRYNQSALDMREDVKSAQNDSEKIKQALMKANGTLNDFQQKYMALNLKSVEVQNIRTQMIDNLMTSNQLYTLSTQADFNFNSPSDEFKQLSQRSAAMQQRIGAELDALNTQYSK